METTKHHFTALRPRNTKRACLFLSVLWSRLWRRTWLQVVYLGGNHGEELKKWGEWDKGGEVEKNSYFCYKEHSCRQWTLKSIKIFWKVKGVYLRTARSKERRQGHYSMEGASALLSCSYSQGQIQKTLAIIKPLKSPGQEMKESTCRDQFEVIWSLQVISTISGTGRTQDKALKIWDRVPTMVSPSYQ